MTTKKCYKCEVEKDINLFGKDKSTKSGLDILCKQCRKERRNKYYKKNREHILFRRKERKKNITNNYKNIEKIKYKTCIRCNQIKNAYDFYIENGEKDGFRATCKSCDSISAKNSRENNKKNYENRKIIENKICYKCNKLKSIIYFSTDRSKRDGLSYYCKECENNDNKKYRETNKEKEKKRNAKYARENPEKIKIRSARRRALKNDAPGDWTLEDEKQMFFVQDGKCWYCNSDFYQFINEKCKIGYHVEHRTPLSRGGTNFPSNLCLSCPSCNCIKFNKTEEEFRKSLSNKGEE